MKKNVINVIDCGADPSGTKDCTEAFREALKQAQSAAGLLVPRGTYMLSGLIKGDPSLLVPPDPEKKKEDGGPVADAVTSEL